MAIDIDKPETVTKKRVLIESKIVIEPSERYWPWHDEAKLAKKREEWAAEFMEFIRDHRSQDVNNVSVERVYEDQCTGCGREWEVELYDDDTRHCAGCGKLIEVVR